MIVSVTANTTIDQTLFIPKFERNRTMRARATVQSMGGKPTDASWILGELGIPSLALGFAAGAMGEKVKALLHARGVTTDFIAVGGDTRLNVVIISEEDDWASTITTSTLEVTPEHVAALRARYLTALNEATVVVLGGTLPRAMPPAFYTEFIGLARDRDIPVIFDAAEPNLSAGLAAAPTYIKPNHDELAALVGQPELSLEGAYAAGLALLDQYGTAPIITLGGEGALAVLPEGIAYRIPPLPIAVVSASGAGDGVLAGLAASILRGQPIEEGLKLGFAAAAAVCLQAGTADCRRADVERLLPQVALIPYP
ncbi:MAG: 1-phosphofructokinase family hexose kinase [Chloroflexi bacterium]|nr:1-phosphofructokinase family hexose kinase [Chloroflexota bacterium]